MASLTETAEVLYVDDDPSFAQMISRMLERESDAIAVETAESAAAGIEIVRSDSIDCVVSDYSMPEADGLEFLRMVRETYEDLPFLLVTGRGSEDIASDAISAGVTDYIQKARGSDHYTLLANRITNAVEQYRSKREIEKQKRDLEELKNRFQSFVTHSPDVITVVDETGTIRYQSPAAERVLDSEPSEAVGTDGIELVHPEDRTHVTERFRELVGGERESFAVEHRVEHDDGTVVWVESIASPSGELDEGRYVVNSRDVTGRKERERELEQKTERLDEFAGIVSHDLQNPLSVVDGRITLAKESSENPEVADHLERAEGALDRMDDIIDATLTLARKGRTVDRTEPVDVDDLVEECFRTVTPREATLRVSVEDLTIRADPERLRHVLENLFANAVEHGGEDVTVRIGRVRDGIYIADDGPGIPEDEREEIFDPGYSLAEEGTGFGLAIVEEVVEAHGWDVDVAESDDGGARFEITGIQTI